MLSLPPCPSAAAGQDESLRHGRHSAPALATGAGAEMRCTLGTTDLAGMPGVTFVGVILTPEFYYAIAGIVDRSKPKRSSTQARAAPTAAITS